MSIVGTHTLRSADMVYAKSPSPVTTTTAVRVVPGARGRAKSWSARLMIRKSTVFVLPAARLQSIRSSPDASNSFLRGCVSLPGSAYTDAASSGPKRL